MGPIRSPEAASASQSIGVPISPPQATTLVGRGGGGHLCVRAKSFPRMVPQDEGVGECSRAPEGSGRKLRIGYVRLAYEVR
jgi:hypothetical protein